MIAGRHYSVAYQTIVNNNYDQTSDMYIFNWIEKSGIFAGVKVASHGFIGSHFWLRLF